MKKYVLVSAFIAFVGCNTTSPDGDDDKVGLMQHDEVSGCGGFNGGGRDESRSEYCENERIIWTYDSDEQLLWIANTRLLLNCCGVRSMTVTEVGPGEYHITEYDGDEERCACTCFIDYSVEVTIPAIDEIVVEIEREITDDPGKSGTVWQGALETDQQSGVIVIHDEDVLHSNPTGVMDACDEEGL